MVQLTHLLFSLSLCAAVYSTPVDDDISAISMQVTALDNTINGFPPTGGTLVSALAVHADSTALESTLTQTTTDLMVNGAFNESHGRAILNSLEVIEPIWLDMLRGFTTKEPAFASLPIGGIEALFLQDLRTLQADTVSFGNALIADMPSDLKAETTSLVNNITGAFAIPIAVYQ
ncbi:hydrophobic surface binding protein [Mycena vulgaris]|nr:hydrophobic surface binding protein [Mycena vulgaris]